MIGTFIVELSLAAYTLWRYKLNRVSRLVIVMLVLLAVFQLSEYMVCQLSGLNPLTWSRIGYIAITALPPLGVHLAYEIAVAKKRPLLLPAYILSGAFVAFFAFVGQSIQGQVCLGNYVIFNMAPGSWWLYALYYYGFVAGALMLCAKLAKHADSKRRKSLNLLAIGYAVFLIPTTTANILAPDTIAGIPSIMCGFAVIMAVILVVLIMPKVGQKK